MSEPSCCTTKFFTEDLLAIEMKKTKQKSKTETLMNNPVYLAI